MACFMQAGTGEGVELSTPTRAANFAETSDSAPAFRYTMLHLLLSKAGIWCHLQDVSQHANDSCSVAAKHAAG